MLSSKLSHDGDLTTLSLTGTLDENTAPTLRPTIDELLASKPRRVHVDLAELAMIDTPGVAALVGIYKHVHADGGDFKVVNAQGQPQAIFKLLRFDKVFL